MGRSLLILLAFLTAAVGAGLLTARVWARPDSITIGSLTLDVGEQGSVELRALDLPQPGPGAWTIDVVHEPGIISTLDCVPPVEGGVCGLLSPGTDRVRGTSAAGLVGDVTLAVITFRCEAEGISPLSIRVEVWAYAGIGLPDPEPNVQDGAITCVVRVEPGATEQPAPTTTPVPVFPDAGTGNSSGGGSPIWLVAAVASAGVAAGAALGALVVRFRRG